MRFINVVPSTHRLHPRPPHLYMRACRQCVHESARLSRALCSHAWYSKNCGERQNHRLSLCHLPHALATHYFLRLTRARGRRFLRGWKILLNDFCRAFGHSKAREEKSFFKSLRGRTMFAPTTQSQSPLNSQNKRFMPIRFFFCICRRKRKSYQKENAEIRFRALRSTTTAVGGRHRLLKKAGENFIESKQKYYCKRKSGRKKSDG